MMSANVVVALSLVIGGGLLQGAAAQQTSLVSAVLPASRAVQLGTPATAFATIINSGSVTATGCQIALPAGLAADFYYQATDPATNAPIPGYKNVPVDIGAGQPKSFLIALTPQAVFAAQDVRLRFYCANAPDAAVYSGLNTLLLSSSATPGPDVVALAATVKGDGIVDVPLPTGTGFFAVASVNVGASATMSAIVASNSALPLSLSICQTNPTTGSCLAPPSAAVTPTTINAGATPTFAVFAAGSSAIAFDPAGNRIFVMFRDASGAVKGATSVAVRTVGAPPANVAPIANAGLPRNVSTGSTVTLDATGSFDRDGDPLTYIWTLTGKPSGSAASLSYPTTPRPTFVADLVGTYIASLVVNDGKVNSTPSTVQIEAANRIKIESGGAVLPDDAIAWSCVVDISSGLMWEVKTDDGGLRDKDWVYTAYEQTGSNESGVCDTTKTCNQFYFRDAVNAAGLCGQKDWRLATVTELEGLRDEIQRQPSLLTDYYPNTPRARYWTGSGYSGVTGYIWWVDFGSYTSGSTPFKDIQRHVRLVRSIR